MEIWWGNRVGERFKESTVGLRTTENMRDFQAIDGLTIRNPFLL